MGCLGHIVQRWLQQFIQNQYALLHLNMAQFDIPEHCEVSRV